MFEPITEMLKNACFTPCKVIIEKDEIGEDGAPIKAEELNLKCFYTNTHSRTYGTEKVTNSSSGEMIFQGDIYPDCNEIYGKVEVFEKIYEISSSEKAIDPMDINGKVVFTRLRVK